MTAEELHEKCLKLFDTINVTEQAENVEITTKEQSNAKERCRLRSGQITTSNVKAVCVADIESPAMTTVNAVCGVQNFKNNATMYGCKHEKDAHKAVCHSLC